MTPSIQPGLPPGPKGTLIGGSIRQFRAGLLDFLLNTARDYGPLASFRIGPRRVFLASGPDLIEQVLVTDAKHYIKHFGARAFRPVLGNARARFGAASASSSNRPFSKLASLLMPRP
jgi:hypothetical protein